jgi:hypothetical protein
VKLVEMMIDIGRADGGNVGRFDQKKGVAIAKRT